MTQKADVDLDPSNPSTYSCRLLRETFRKELWRGFEICGLKTTSVARLAAMYMAGNVALAKKLDAKSSALNGYPWWISANSEREHTHNIPASAGRMGSFLKRLDELLGLAFAKMTTSQRMDEELRFPNPRSTQW